MFDFLRRRDKKRRPVIDFDVAGRFHDHCTVEAASFKNKLLEVLESAQETDREIIQGALEHSLKEFPAEALATGRRSLIEAHCYAIVAAKGLGALYQENISPSIMNLLDHDIAKELQRMKSDLSTLAMHQILIQNRVVIYHSGQILWWGGRVQGN